MRFFVSAGEPSGDLHAANLFRSLRARHPGAECFGFGGPQLAAAGADVLFPLASHAIMGLSGIAQALPTMFRIARLALDEVARRRPTAAVLIDYPGFHWHLAKRMRRAGVPVISFVPPQIWAWASHRVYKMRRCFHRVLCSLPFEEAWYRDRGVTAEYVGHPYFDELHRQRVDVEFVESLRNRRGPTIAVLPGSRGGELDRNLEMQIRALRIISRARPNARIQFACFKDEHRQRVMAAADSAGIAIAAHVGRMAEILSAADAAIAVSGSVGLELLHHGVPSVVVYRVNRLYRAIARRVLNVPFISIVNLLAERELFPEFLTCEDASAAIAARVLRWLDSQSDAEKVRESLRALKRRVGQPGACDRAAAAIIECAGRSLAA